jgi:hypothetical protein
MAGARARRAFLFAAVIAAVEPRARAQSDADLAAARSLFGEALADEQRGEYAAALAKFERVRAVRDTQAVRYRVATCLEGLGRLRAAVQAYTSAAIATTSDPESTKVAQASRDAVTALEKRMAQVVVELPPGAPRDVTVAVDAEAVSRDAIGAPLAVDPGTHDVTASAEGFTPFRTAVTIAPAARATVRIVLDPVAPGAPSASNGSPPLPPAAPDAPPASASSSDVPAIVAFGAAGILAVGTVALLVARESDIHTIESTCPGDVCATSREPDVTSTRNRALLEGPFAIGTGVAAAVSAGIGVYFVTRPRAPATAAIAPWVDRSSQGVVIRAWF